MRHKQFYLVQKFVPNERLKFKVKSGNMRVLLSFIARADILDPFSYSKCVGNVGYLIHILNHFPAISCLNSE